MWIYLSLIICLIGAVIYLVSDGTKYAELKEMGRLAYFGGLLAFLINSPHIVGLIK